MIKPNRNQILIVGVVLVVAGLMANSFRLTKENKVLGLQIETLKKDPQSIAKEEIKQLTEKLARLVVLPEGEEPVVATVTDKDKLKDQPVFEKVENGDKLLIYAKAKKAYVYRPEKDVLIDVVPVNIGDTGPAVSGVSEENPMRVALVNGSKSEGITGELESRINDLKIGGLSVVTKSVAKSDGYEKTQVMDLTGKFAQQAKELALLLGGEVITETDEGKPDADLMIIVGGDFK